MRYLLVLAPVLAAGCALSDPLDRAFGPDGRTVRELVETFPPERKAGFELMRRRCSRCHTLSEPLAAHVPAGGWGAQVRKMARKPGAVISDPEAEEIAAFLEHLFEQRR